MPVYDSYVTTCLCAAQVDVVLLSPERLSSDSFKLNVLQPIASTLGLLVIDEVHCISVWGHDFRPEYRRIGIALQLIPSDTPVLGTTATANERVLDDVRAVMGDDVTIQRGSLLRTSLALYVIHMDDTASRLAWLAANLRNMPPSSGIIYTNTRHDADQVSLTTPLSSTVVFSSELLPFRSLCHGRFDCPTFSVAERPAFYNFETLWVRMAFTPSRFLAVCCA